MSLALVDVDQGMWTAVLIDSLSLMFKDSKLSIQKICREQT